MNFQAFMISTHLSAGHDIIQLIRQESTRINPLNNGKYYALHIRRGDFKEQVKISAEEIILNLHHPNGRL